MYHGAEHKVVFNHESRLPLTVENARVQSRLHPRCGTSFLLFVLLVSILLFAFIPKTAPFLVKFGGRLLLVPVIAGLSYEVLRLTAKKRAAPIFAARRPGTRCRERRCGSSPRRSSGSSAKSTP